MDFLAIDQGNTRTKFGFFRDGELVRVWATTTEKDAAAATLGAAVFHVPEVPPSVAIGLCTVVPELLPQWQRMTKEHDCPLTLITGQSPTPLNNAYETPETLGPDRLMAAVAAAHLVGTPIIPISLGTATVVDAVSRDLTYLGGIIAPGIGIVTEALAVSASALWPAEWQEPARTIGRSSKESINNGLFYQTIGGIRTMVQAIRNELATPAPLALTGGWAQRIAPHLDGVALVDEYLVLQGIAVTVFGGNSIVRGPESA